MPRKASGKKLSIRRVVRLVRDEQRRSAAEVRLLLVGRGEGLRALAAAVSAERPGNGGHAAPPEAVDVGDGAPSLAVTADDVVLVACAGLDPGQLRAIVQQAHDARAGLLVVAPPQAAGPATRAALDAGALSAEIEVLEAGVAPERSRLARAVVDSAGERAPALAARFPWLRPAAASRLIRRTALENAAIGVLVFLPGADMPVMTLNQIRLVLRLAQAYGRKVEPLRAPEVLGVVAAGFGLRALAQQGLKSVPLAGWVLKGAVGYSGTVALGKATVAFYESGAGEAVTEMGSDLSGAVEDRLPTSVVRLLHDRLRPAGAVVGPDEAETEPPAKIETGVDDQEDGGRPGGCRR